MGTRDLIWDSARARALVHDGNLGGLIRLARHARGWRQADLGRVVGYSASTISRLETRRRPGPDVDTLRRIARAINLPPDVIGVLIGDPRPDTVIRTSGHRVREDDPMLRRELLAAGVAVSVTALGRFDNALAALPAPHQVPSPAGIDTRLRQARRLFDHGHLPRLLDELPDLLATAHDLADQGHHDPTDFARLSACYNLATDTMTKIGRRDTSRITADRATTYARLSGSPVARATAARSMSIVLRHEGRESFAHQLTLRAATDLDRTGLRTPTATTTYAQLLCTAAYNAAQAGRHDDAVGLITDANRAATRLPAGSPSTAITPAQVTLYEVGVHWALGDPGTAIRTGQTLRPAQFGTPERRARYHTDLARAWWQWGKPEPTARELLAAYSESPAEVRDRPSIRTIATTLAHEHRTVPGVPQLATALKRLA